MKNYTAYQDFLQEHINNIEAEGFDFNTAKELANHWVLQYNSK